MSKANNYIGYSPANPYQCPTNFVKPGPCPGCENKATCQESVTFTPSGPIVGFKHTNWVTDECVDVGDGIVRFASGPIDLSVITAAMFQKAIFAELSSHDIPEMNRLNDDIKTKILQCETVISVITNEGGSITITHTGQESITAFVYEDGTEQAMGDRLCTLKNVYTYENLYDTGVAAADVEAAITAAGLTFESVTVEVGAVAAADPVPAQDKVIVVTCDSPFDFEFDGKTLTKCKEDCIYVSSEPTEEGGGKRQAQVKTNSTTKLKADWITEAKGLKIELTGNETVAELQALIEAKK